MAKKFSTKDWEAMEDARTLARYQDIMASTSRRNAAMRQAKREAESLQKQVDVMKRAYGGKIKK